MAHMLLFTALILGLVFGLIHSSPVKMQLLVGGIPANGSSCDASCKWRGRGVGSQKPTLTPVAAFAGRRTGRERRFVLQGTRWRGKHVSYHVSQYPEDLSRAEVDAALHSAFQLWASATSLRFTAVSSPSVSPAGAGAAAGPHLDVRWERGAHGDWDAFDGRGGVLAHAAYPSHGGALHFDADERWATNDADAARDRPSLEHIAAHEIGHALGLAHSRAPGAVMAPFYGRARALAPLRRLPADDEAGAAALYGPRALPPAAAPASVPSHAPHAPHAPQGPCGGQEAWLDAALTAPDGFLYLLQGERVLRRGARRLDPPAPLALNDTWPELPPSVDAAFTAPSGKIFFFKGSRYWRYSGVGRAADEGYPRSLRRGFPGVPASPDAALLWPGNGKLYFFKGDLYWRYDASPVVTSGGGAGRRRRRRRRRRGTRRRRYPRPLRAWKGVPSAPDAAVAFNGHTYFFKGPGYYRFNDATFSVEHSSPPFPRSTAFWWLRCRGLVPSPTSPSLETTSTTLHPPASPTLLPPTFPSSTQSSYSELPPLSPSLSSLTPPSQAISSLLTSSTVSSTLSSAASTPSPEQSPQLFPHDFNQSTQLSLSQSPELTVPSLTVISKSSSEAPLSLQPSPQLPLQTSPRSSSTSTSSSITAKPPSTTWLPPSSTPLSPKTSPEPSPTSSSPKTLPEPSTISSVPSTPSQTPSPAPSPKMSPVPFPAPFPLPSPLSSPLPSLPPSILLSPLQSSLPVPRSPPQLSPSIHHQQSPLELTEISLQTSTGTSTLLGTSQSVSTSPPSVISMLSGAQPFVTET